MNRIASPIGSLLPGWSIERTEGRIRVTRPGAPAKHYDPINHATAYALCLALLEANSRTCDGECKLIAK
ncbi:MULTISPECIES: hypothetical protein [unclassified Pseudomonas]|uniref:hypothetical protein n=1 Tax=unclassified Pseudomonas TaxID=196821 RepID=UPI00131B45FA|nr:MULTISPECIES: hypothetical protein [unclassified Pseudomonas]